MTLTAYSAALPTRCGAHNSKGAAGPKHTVPGRRRPLITTLPLKGRHHDRNTVENMDTQYRLRPCYAVYFHSGDAEPALWLLCVVLPGRGHGYTDPGGGHLYLYLSASSVVCTRP